MAPGDGAPRDGAPRDGAPRDGAAAATEDSLTSPGPYAVGAREFTFVDTSRKTPANGTYAGAADRTLMTKVWYPAETAGDGTVPSAAGPFPVVLYAHGFLSSRNDLPLIKAHLASHGYVVVAPEFPLSSGAAQGGPTFSDTGEQPADLAFVAKEVSTLGGGDAPLAAALDMSRQGAVGYSLGGATVLAAAYHQTLHLPDVKVAVAYAPLVCPFTKGFFARSVPTVVISGTADQLVPFHTLEETALAYAKPPFTLVRVVGGTHQGFSIGAFAGTGPNPDGVPCQLVRSTVGCSIASYPDLAAKLNEGVPGGAFEASLCGPVCGEQYAATLPNARQHALAKSITLAQLEAVLRERTDAALYLDAVLPQTPDVLVERTRSKPPAPQAPTSMNDGGACSSP